MAKRTREASPSSKGLAAGQLLRRQVLNSWGWVATEVTSSSSITRDHLLATCGLSRRNNHPFCRTKYKSKSRIDQFPDPATSETYEETLDDVIVISDGEDEGHICSKKSCRANPNCLNYLGQDKWEDEDSTVDNFLPVAQLGENPILLAKDPDIPVGLKNLGATCYANASLQVWFRSSNFTSGVYSCQPLESESKFMDSPIFQLQVTFAALQESIQNVFNPSKLVESLQLRAAEQQDAQEFSKLFMTHLDAEFKKQPDPALQSLVNAQFEGEQVYGTKCHKCNYCSERSSNFWELEVNFQNNSKLEDRIDVLLEPETLTGDNRYRCVQCNSLQDATRYTELRKLPPTLHISLLRFVYDLKTMERKKSKSAIVFPKVLDMNRFIGSSSKREEALSHGPSSNVYELRGILLHKGPSAYHGHYEAQVFDYGSNSWYQFNDEEVTQIDKLGDKRPSKKVVIDVDDSGSKDEENPTGSKRKKKANGSRKRQRVDDSEDEMTTPPKSIQTENSSDIYSKDAYMLIYALRQSDPKVTTSEAIPPRAMNVIKELNTLHDKECEKYMKREKSALSALKTRRAQVLDIYRSWAVSSADEDCVVVSRQALEEWLTQYSVKGLFNNSELDDNDETKSKFTVVTVNDILCEHGLLDHRSADKIKRISRGAYTKIIEQTKCIFEPALSLNDVCPNCVNSTFKERLYQIEHPRLVAEFNEKANVADEHSGFWISKAWLKDWSLQKPKMHITSEGDPPPDSPDFVNDVRCEHGSLSLNNAARRRISPEACKVLTALFPNWTPISVIDETCSICEVVVSELKANNFEHRKRAETEKAKLKHLLEYAFDGDMFLLENVPCALVPLDFVRSWRRWANKPAGTNRPDTLDNSIFFCEHGMLKLDLSDIESTAAIIKRSEWEDLVVLYSAHPLIALSPSDEDHTRFRLDLPVCSECRQKRLSDWAVTEIVVQLHNKNPSKENGEPPRKKVAYGKNSARQSKRLRQIRELVEKKRVTVAKIMTVKDIKVAISEQFEIPTICQRLLLHGKELIDNEASIESLCLLSNDVLELHEESESHDFDESYEAVSRRDEGKGFGGTLLGGT